MSNPILIRHLGLANYESTVVAMRTFTDTRTSETPDEIWLVEHTPVFTLGLAADSSHVLNAGTIPVIQTDRGGEVTYHGPGQAVVYLLIDLRRHTKNKWFIREFVQRIEQTIINMLAEYNITGERKPGAPGIYLTHTSRYGEWQGAKIAALGLKVKGNGCIYHGFALNVSMNLEPFSRINPCGYVDLKTVDMKTVGIDLSLQEAQLALTNALCKQLNVTTNRVN